MLLLNPKRLKIARKNSGLTINTICEKLGYSQMMIYHWENGTRRIFVDTLTGLASLYKVSILDFFEEVNN